VSEAVPVAVGVGVSDSDASGGSTELGEGAAVLPGLSWSHAAGSEVITKRTNPIPAKRSRDLIGARA
jgi:hypothetical protein